jgi:hypothetical protein
MKCHKHGCNKPATHRSWGTYLKPGHQLDEVVTPENALAVYYVCYEHAAQARELGLSAGYDTNLPGEN